MRRTNYEFIGWDALLCEWGPKVIGALLILLAAWFIGKATKWALMRASLSSGMIGVMDRPTASAGVKPNNRSAPPFQLCMRPSRVLLTIASSEFSTMAASQAPGSATGHGDVEGISAVVIGQALPSRKPGAR